MAFVATEEDGKPVLRNVLDIGGEGIPFFARLRYDYAYRARLNALLRQRAAGSRADVPLGTIRPVTNIKQPSSSRLPALATRSTGISTAAVYGLPGASGGVSTSQNQAQLPTQPTPKEQAMDLGSIITTLGGQYIQARFGQPSAPPIMSAAGFPRPVMQPRLVSDTYGVVPSVGMGVRPAGLPILAAGVSQLPAQVFKIAASIAAAWGVTEITEDVIAAAYAASKVKCRRKRKRLATMSDIKDLAALKSVIGGGKALEVWIAKNGR
jgi:hypothetical protein